MYEIKLRFRVEYNLSVYDDDGECTRATRCLPRTRLFGTSPTWMDAIAQNQFCNNNACARDRPSPPITDRIGPRRGRQDNKLGGILGYFISSFFFFFHTHTADTRRISSLVRSSRVI